MFSLSAGQSSSCAASTVGRTTDMGSLYVGMYTSTVGHRLVSSGSGTGLRCSGQTIWKKPSTRTSSAYSSAAISPEPAMMSTQVAVGSPCGMVSVNRQYM